MGVLREDEPKPMDLSLMNQILLYLSGSYVITSIIMVIINLFN